MEKFIFLKDLANFIDYFIPFSKLARKIKELNFNRNGNNKVYLINGNERRRIKMNGVIKDFEIVFNGKNNLVEIEEPFTFQQVRMIVTCDNNHFSIKKNSFISNAYINISTGSTIEIGENFKSIHDGRFFAGGIASIKIGNNCLFSRRLCIYPGDGYILYNKDTNNVENPILNPIKIGDNVWIGDDVMILKNVTIPNNTVIGAKSLITKSFTEENTLISGVTAEVKKHNVYWRE